MGFIVAKLLLKIVAFIGAILNTVGFLSFFFWDSLQPYRWQLFLGGLLLIITSEAIGSWLAKRHR
jgi:hypothetical protein